jgi:hypothetical protein
MQTTEVSAQPIGPVPPGWRLDARGCWVVTHGDTADGKM